MTQPPRYDPHRTEVRNSLGGCPQGCGFFEVWRHQLQVRRESLPFAEKQGVVFLDLLEAIGDAALLVQRVAKPERAGLQSRRAGTDVEITSTRECSSPASISDAVRWFPPKLFKNYRDST